jgi:hypothetical protein
MDKKSDPRPGVGSGGDVPVPGFDSTFLRSARQAINISAAEIS